MYTSALATQREDAVSPYCLTTLTLGRLPNLEMVFVVDMTAMASL